MIPLERVEDLSSQRNFEAIGRLLPGARFHLPMPPTPGPLPVSCTYTPTLAAGSQFLIVSATAYVTAGSAMCAMNVFVDGASVASHYLFFNQTGVHMAFPLLMVDASAWLTYGKSHTIQLQAANPNGVPLVSDLNDRFTIAVLEST